MGQWCDVTTHHWCYYTSKWCDSFMMIPRYTSEWVSDVMWCDVMHCDVMWCNAMHCTVMHPLRCPDTHRSESVMCCDWLRSHDTHPNDVIHSWWSLRWESFMNHMTPWMNHIAMIHSWIITMWFIYDTWMNHIVRCDSFMVIHCEAIHSRIIAMWFILGIMWCIHSWMNDMNEWYRNHVIHSFVVTHCKGIHSFMDEWMILEWFMISLRDHAFIHVIGMIHSWMNESYRNDAIHSRWFIAKPWYTLQDITIAMHCNTSR